MASWQGNRHSRQPTLDRKLGEGGASEVLVPGYDNATMLAIMDTVKWRPDAARDQIIKRIADARLSYHVMNSERARQAPPSTRERNLQSMLTTLQDAARAFRDIEPVDLAELEAAGADLAETEGGLPDVIAIQIADPGIPDEIEPGVIKAWDARSQITASLERLYWLIRCTEQALKRVHREKAPKGGNRADEALHDLIKDLHSVYFEFGETPQNPGRAGREGELMDFLEAALKPLGFEREREALYSLWRRATETY